MATKTKTQPTTTTETLNQSQHSLNGSHVYTAKPTDAADLEAQLDAENREFQRETEEESDRAHDPEVVRQVERAFSTERHERIVPVKHPWYAVAWAWIVSSLAMFATGACSAVIGALAAVPLTPSVFDVAHHFGRVGFWDYHWTKFVLSWFDHYTDSLRFWYYATAATVAVATFGLALCTGRSK